MSHPLAGESGGGAGGSKPKGLGVGEIFLEPRQRAGSLSQLLGQLGALSHPLNPFLGEGSPTKID